MAWALSSGVGLLGKAPCQADFIRIGAQEPAAQSLHRWLEEGMEHLRNAGNSALPESAVFLFSARGFPNVLLGALGPSADQVGRSFPLCVFAALPGDVAAANLPLLPAVFRSFLEAAATLVKDAPRLSATELTQRVRALPVPGAQDLAAAEEERRQALSGHRTAELIAALGPEAGPDAGYYAFRTFASACANGTAAPPNASVTLDCPTTPELGAFFWLELAGRLLRWKDAPPSFFWSPAAPARVLIALGPAPAQALAYLAKPDPKSTRLWPLTTRAAAAVTQAKEALSADQRRALEQPNGTVEELFGALAH